MRRKPEAVMFDDNDGMFTLGCGDKKTAIKAMLELWHSPLTNHENVDQEVVFNEETVKENIMYRHVKCECFNLGDNYCIRCGETCGTTGRKTFAIYF